MPSCLSGFDKFNELYTLADRSLFAQLMGMCRQLAGLLAADIGGRCCPDNVCAYRPCRVRDDAAVQAGDTSQHDFASPPGVPKNRADRPKSVDEHGLFRRAASRSRAYHRHRIKRVFEICQLAQSPAWESSLDVTVGAIVFLGLVFGSGRLAHSLIVGGILSGGTLLAAPAAALAIGGRSAAGHLSGPAQAGASAGVRAVQAGARASVAAIRKR